MCWSERENPHASGSDRPLQYLFSLLRSRSTCRLDRRKGHRNLPPNKEQKDLWTSWQGDVCSETVKCTRERWGPKELEVDYGRERAGGNSSGHKRVRRVCMGPLGQEGWYWSECAFVKAVGCQEREKIRTCVSTGGGGRGKETSRGLQSAVCGNGLCSRGP